MGIKGLTGAAAWPRIGELRKGAPKPNEKQPGRDLGEVLRFTGRDQTVLEDWVETFGADRVDELNVRLPYPTVDRCLSAWREHWVAGGLVCRCDGEQHVLWLGDDGEHHGPATGEDVPAQACPGRDCPAKPVGRLEVVVTDLPRMGVVTVLTTSIHDIMNIDGALRALAMSFGDLSRIPLRLTRVPREISTPTADGKRARRTVHLLHLEAAPRWVRYMLDAGGRAPVALLEDVTYTTLPAPGDDGVVVDVETGELVSIPPQGDPADVPAPNEDFGAPPAGGTPAGAEPVESFTDAIETATTIEDLRALWPAITGIDQANRKANVVTLWHRKAVQILEAAAFAAQTVEECEDIRTRLGSIKAGTPGIEGALDVASSRMRELVRARKRAEQPEMAM